MSLSHYGVLKGKAVDRIMATSQNEHFQILIDADGERHRIAINVKSKLDPPEVLFYMDDDFMHPITDLLLQQNPDIGFTRIQSQGGSIALDFIRGNLFSRDQLKPIPYNLPGADNDLNEKIDFYVQQSINDNDAVVYAFGEKWGPENGKRDQYFGFLPGNGIHDIHMNQGNSGQYQRDNGVWQDGGLLMHLPSRNRWVAVFIAFQVQAFHTDDHTGDPLSDLPGDDPQPDFEYPVRIIAAMVNPQGNDVGMETVILLNTINEEIDLEGWQLIDKNNNSTMLHGKIKAADTLKVILDGRDAQLSNKGGTITLLNKDEIKIDGVSYTKEQASQENILIEL